MDYGISASSVIGNDSYSFGKVDLYADVDAIVLGNLKAYEVKKGLSTFSAAFNNYYKVAKSNTHDQRFNKFYSIYGGTSNFKTNLTLFLNLYLEM